MKALIRVNIDLKNQKNDDIVEFKFDYYNFDLIIPLEDNNHILSNKERKENLLKIDNFLNKYEGNRMILKPDLIRYHNMIIKGKLKSLSRIDNIPILEIDLSQLDRNDKISKILE